MSERARPHIRTVLRDVASFLFGWTIIFKQAGTFFAPPAQTSELLLLLAAIAIGLPGAAQLLSTRAGVAASTGGQPSQPPAEESSSSSPGA